MYDRCKIYSIIPVENQDIQHKHRPKSSGSLICTTPNHVDTLLGIINYNTDTSSLFMSTDGSGAFTTPLLF